MKAAAVVLLAVTLAALVAPPAATQQIWTEQQITVGGSPWRGSPQIWDGTIYYTDQKSGYNEIYVWDETSGSRRLLGGDGVARSSSAVYGDSVVVARNVSPDRYDLTLWSPSSGEQAVTTAHWARPGADLYESNVVWEDHRASYSQIYIWDPVNGERALSPSASNQTVPKIWGNRVIWTQGDTDQWHSDGGIYMWTPEGGTTRIGSGDSAAIYEDRVVTWTNAWWEPQPGGNPTIYHPGYLNEWTPATGFHMILEHNKSTSSLEMWGDLVVGNGIAWDPTHGFTDTHLLYPSVYGNQIAGVRGTDIYLLTMVPEPASLVGLLAGVGLLGGLLRRRTKEAR